jgi:acid phosphatase
MKRYLVSFFIGWVMTIPACAGLPNLVPDPASAQNLPPVFVPAPEPGVAYQRFVALGDMGTGRAGQKRVAEAMARRAQRDGINFIITVGDNFYPSGVASADDSQWREKFEEVYAESVLQVPVYASLGNHDYDGDPEAQIAYGQRNPRWILPARYYTFTRALSETQCVQFFALDTTPIHRGSSGSDAQIEWLDVELAKSKARWRIVFGHHPVFSHGLHGRTEALVQRVKPLLEKHGVDLYVAGHDHHLELLRPVAGVTYVISGGGGGTDNAYPAIWTDESVYTATRGGFALFRLSEKDLVIEFVRSDGDTQFVHVLAK